MNVNRVSQQLRGADRFLLKRKPNNLDKAVLSTLLAFTLLLVMGLPVFAFEGRGGDEIIIAEGEVIEDDLYVGAQTLIVDGVVKGDLFFGASTAIINGTVEGDVTGGGQTVVINGTVEDVRVGLTSLTLGEGSHVQGDLMMGGFNLDAQSGSVIDGDALLGAGQAKLAGRIAKDLMAGVNGLEILGTIGGDVDAEVGVPGEPIPFNPAQFMPDAPEIDMIPGGLTIGDSASIEGKLTYRSAQPSDITDVAAGGTNFELNPESEFTQAEPTLTDQIWRIGRRVIALILIGLFLGWLLRRPIQRAANQLDTDLGSSSLWGIITTIVTPFVLFFGLGILILLAVIFGAIQLDLIGEAVMALGVPTLIAIGAGFFAIWGLVSKVIVGYWLGRKMSPNSASIWGPLLIGIIIIAILSSIPYLGTLVNIVVAILGLGATWLVLRNKSQEPQEPGYSEPIPEPVV
ncbi:MAG: polymer-forming cytoskeletal protein [Chloroflexota bacterium]